MSIKISIAMITKNSQKYLKEVLSSCGFADEIVIVDSGSNDNTIDIAKSFGVKILEKEWMGFGKQKQYAVNNTTNDWVFVLDSDEVITKELKNEIEKRVGQESYRAYYIPRLNYFFGKPIKRCGLYPDATIRLFDKNFAHFNDSEVHERVITKEKTGVFKNHFLHYAYETIDEFIDKQNRYSSLNAKRDTIKAMINPTWTFFKLYFIKLGFLEGFRGYIISKLYAQYTFWKYVK